LVLRTRKPFFQSRPGRLLLWVTIVVATLTCLIPYLGFFQSLFGFTPLSLSLMGTAGAIALGYIAATEAAKIWFFNGWQSPGRPKSRRSGATPDRPDQVSGHLPGSGSELIEKEQILSSGT
jgi:hypothetical protein